MIVWSHHSRLQRRDLLKRLGKRILEPRSLLLKRFVLRSDTCRLRLSARTLLRSSAQRSPDPQEHSCGLPSALVSRVSAARRTSSIEYLPARPASHTASPSMYVTALTPAAKRDAVQVSQTDSMATFEKASPSYSRPRPAAPPCTAAPQACASHLRAATQHSK